MALIFMSGFEWGTNREFDIRGGSSNTSDKRTGNYSWNIGNGQFLGKNLPQNLTEIYIQFAFYSDYGLANVVFFSIRKGGTHLISLRKNDNLQLEVRSGWGGSTLYCTSNIALQTGVWYVIELHYKIDDSNGIIELRIDGNLEATYYGDTKPGADSDFDQIYWGATTGVTIFNIDDVIFFDTSGTVNNSWPNCLKVVLLKPTADSGPNEWEPTPSGSHYACIDEVPPSGDDYLKAAQADLMEVFDLENLPDEAKAVKGVRADFWGLKGSTQDPDRLQIGLKIDNTDYLSDDLNLPLEQGLFSEFYEQNPAGGNWTVSAVNGVQMIIKSRN